MGGKYSCKGDKLLIRAIYDIKQCSKLALSLKTLCKLKSPAKEQHEKKKDCEMVFVSLFLQVSYTVVSGIKLCTQVWAFSGSLTL